ARAVSCRARAVAAPSHASRRPRNRRHYRAAIPSNRDLVVGHDQARRRRRAGGAGGGGVDLRSVAQRHLHVQPQQHPHSAGIWPHVALVGRNAGHAPSASLGSVARDQQQFWIQFALVGSPVRHLSRATCGRARRHDDRYRAVPRSARTQARSHAAPAFPGRGRPISARAAGRRAMSNRRLPPRLALVLLLVAAAALAAFHRDEINPAMLDAWLGALGPWAPIGYVVVYALATVALVPGAIFGLAGGVLFGAIWGSLWNLLGATLGATLAFLLARYLAADWVARKAGGLLKRLIEGVDAE